MTTFILLLNILLPFIYGASMVLYGRYFRNQRAKKTARFSSNTLLVGILLHVVYLLSKGLYFRYFPVSNSFESLSLIALDIAIIYYITEKTQKVRTTGVFFLSIIFPFQLIASLFFKNAGTTSDLLSNPLFAVHTTFTLLGLSALAISSLYALMYWMLAKEIKSRHFGIIYDGLPALDILEKMSKSAVGYGIVLLGFGLLLGHLRAYQLFGYFFIRDPKVVITDIAWVSYAIGWIVVWRYRFHGLRMSIIALLGFIVFSLSLIIGNFIGDTFHRFV